MVYTIFLFLFTYKSSNAPISVVSPLTIWAHDLDNLILNYIP